MKFTGIRGEEKDKVQVQIKNPRIKYSKSFTLHDTNVADAYTSILEHFEKQEHITIIQNKKRGVVT